MIVGFIVKSMGWAFIGILAVILNKLGNLKMLLYLKKNAFTVAYSLSVFDCLYSGKWSALGYDYHSTLELKLN